MSAAAELRAAAQQTALVIDGIAPPGQMYGVIVDEVRMGAIGGLDFWALHRPKFEDSGRVRIIPTRGGQPAVCITGQVVEIGPFEKDDAEFFHAHLIEHGAHPKALKIRKWAAEPQPWSKPRSNGGGQ